MYASVTVSKIPMPHKSKKHDMVSKTLLTAKSQ